jgi:uncharacterized protein YlaI
MKNNKNNPQPVYMCDDCKHNECKVNQEPCKTCIDKAYYGEKFSMYEQKEEELENGEKSV